ncbi:MAG: alanine--tRNA ligase [archaeon]
MNLKQLKGELKKKTDKKPDDYYAVDTLKAKGFHRVCCKSCGKYFWTLEDSEICGEPDCSGGYRFIGDPPTRKKLDFVGVWREFSSLFEKLGYTPIKRYPVVARWRDDTYWTNASIYDFQPHVVSGAVEPPANPLVVPQACVRFNDIDNVGITGRHHTSFVMIGQHAFVPPEKFDVNAYLSHIIQWLEKGMGMPLHEIKFHEDQWGGGGNLGPCMEFYARGLEVGNQVYMTSAVTDKGIKELNLKVLDMGMGHERCAWISQGCDTSYDANFPAVIKKLVKLTGVKKDSDLIQRFIPHSGLLDMEKGDIEKSWKKVAKNVGMSVKDLKEAILPLSGLYSIADHTRTLLFAINDGALPSNVGGCYNLRVILRRALGFIDTYGWDVELSDICAEHAREMKGVFPELEENLDDVQKILEVEKKKYQSTRDKSRRIVEKMKGKKVSENELLELYDSQGVTPELLKEADKSIEIPDDFYSKVAARHPEVERNAEKKEGYDLKGIADTEKIYYKDWKKKSFKARVLKVIKDKVVLDKSAFYPEGGGQLCDLGKLGGFEVTDVQKQGNIIIHTVKGSLKEGQEVEAEIDWDRRMKLAKNHTAAHIIGGAARQVLGKHVWQAGSQIDLDKGRLDITHYEALTEEQKQKIEELANKAVKGKLKISKDFIDRTKAEQEYGFTLYQGGAVPGKEIRVMKIDNWDVQACGGTHLDCTADAEGIKLLKTEKIQDGVVRLVFVAGKAHLEERGKQEEGLAKKCENVILKFAKANIKSSDLNTAAKVLTVQEAQLPNTLERFLKEIMDAKKRRGASEKEFCARVSALSDLTKISELIFTEWKAEKKALRELEEKEAEELMGSAVKVGSARVVAKEFSDFGEGMKVANAITGKNPDAAVLISSPDKSALVVGKSARINAKETLNMLNPNARTSGDTARAIADKPVKDLKAALKKIMENK